MVGITENQAKGLSRAVILGLALFGCLVLARTFFFALFLSEQPAFGFGYAAAPFVWCLGFGLVFGRVASSRGPVWPVFATALLGLLALRANMHLHGSVFHGFLGADLYTLFVLAGDILGLLLAAAITWVVARFKIVPREP